MNLDDTFRRRDTLEVEEVLGVDAAGSEALLKHTAHLLQQLQDEHEPTNGADGSSTTAWEFGLACFLKMLRKDKMSEEELEYVIGEFEENGWNGGLNWYRVMDINYHATPQLAG